MKLEGNRTIKALTGKRMTSMSEKTVVGIDMSLTKTGIVILDDTENVVSQIVKSPAAPRDVKSRMHRFRQIVRDISAVVIDANPVVICIEAYAFSRNMSGHSDLVEAGGLLRSHLVFHGYTLYEVPPTTLKKWGAGSGKGDKTPMIAAMVKRYGVMFETNDEYDAYGLARMAKQIAGIEPPATAAQREAIDVIVSGPKPKVRKTKIKTG